MKSQILVPLILIILIPNLIIQTALWISPSEDIVRHVDCFDRYGNKILNQVCEEKEVGLPLEIKLVVSIVIFFVTIAMWIPFFMDRRRA